MSKILGKVCIDAESDTIHTRFKQTDRTKQLISAIDEAVSHIGMKGDYRLTYYEEAGTYSLVADFSEKSLLGGRRNETA